MHLPLYLALVCMAQAGHAQAVLTPGAPEISLESAGRLNASFPIVNQGNATAGRLQVTSISLNGAKLATALPKEFAVRPNERVMIVAEFVGDALTRESTHSVKMEGSFFEDGKQIPFNLDYLVKLPLAASSSSSAQANTTSGAPNPHEPPNFERANPPGAWVVPTGPYRASSGSSESIAAPPSHSGEVKLYANSSVGFSASPELKPVEVQGLWGYAGPTGVLRIPAKFSEAGSFFNGFARVRSGSRYGLISQTGMFVLLPKYDAVAEAASEGLVAVEPKKGDGWGFADLATGKLVVEPRFAMALPFHEGLAAILTGGRWGYIDKSGSLKIGARFDEAGPFVDGKAKVLLDNRWVYVDRTGAVLPEQQK